MPSVPIRLHNNYLGDGYGAGMAVSGIEVDGSTLGLK
jgi:hypothetical protein